MLPTIRTMTEFRSESIQILHIGDEIDRPEFLPNSNRESQATRSFQIRFGSREPSTTKLS